MKRALLFFFIVTYGIEQTPIVGPIAGGGGGGASGPAGGDLGGTYPNPTVIGLTHATWPGSSGQITFNSGSVGAGDANLNWVSPALLIGTTINDPLGLGVNSNMTIVNNTGTFGDGFFEWATGGNNWLAIKAAKSGGTISSPTDTTASSIVLQVDGLAYAVASGGWNRVAEINLEFLGGLTGQVRMIGNGSDASHNMGLVLDGSLERLIFGNSSGLARNEFAMLKSTAANVVPGATVAIIRWVVGTNAGTCKLVSSAGTSATEVTIRR